jgi:hypothetical protein
MFFYSNCYTITIVLSNYTRGTPVTYTFPGGTWSIKGWEPLVYGNKEKMQLQDCIILLPSQSDILLGIPTVVSPKGLPIRVLYGLNPSPIAWPGHRILLQFTVLTPEFTCKFLFMNTLNCTLTSSYLGPNNFERFMLRHLYTGVIQMKTENVKFRKQQGNYLCQSSM